MFSLCSSAGTWWCWSVSNAELDGSDFSCRYRPPPTPDKDAFTVTVGKCCLHFVSPSPAPVFLALFFFCRMFTFHLHKAEALISSRIEQAGGDMCVWNTWDHKPETAWQQDLITELLKAHMRYRRFLQVLTSPTHPETCLPNKNPPN